METTAKQTLRTYSRGFYGSTGDKLEDLKIIMKDFYITSNWDSYYVTTLVICDIFKEEFKDNMSEIMAKLATCDTERSISVLMEEIFKTNGDILCKNKFNLTKEYKNDN